MAHLRSERRHDNIPLAALLHATRGTYTDAVHRAQAKIGYGDVPASGEFILSAMGWSDASLETVIRWLGATKQAVGQTVETLESRGYLERARDLSDRRRVNLVLTDRGRAAANAARTAIEEVDRKLRDRVGSDSIAHARATLVALIEVKRESLERDRQVSSA